ncbi:hypothetical protein BG003_011203 [Podila horticola]|nr:hypothetical protein BG003_011203 [Podila horticola]
MVKFLAVAALSVAPLAVATAITAEVTVVAPVGNSAAAPSTLPEKKRDCCKTTYAKCELIATILGNLGANQAIWKDPENNRDLASFYYNGLDGKWYQECTAGYCYSVKGYTCKFWVDDSRIGECDAQGLLYNTCTASFCAVYC